MTEFIITTWSILLTAGVGYLVSNSKDSKKKRTVSASRQAVMEEALCAILHEKIMKRCNQLIIIGSVTKEDIDELEYLYTPYKALGGNGTAEREYNRVLNLKRVKDHEE